MRRRGAQSARSGRRAESAVLVAPSAVLVVPVARGGAASPLTPGSPATQLPAGRFRRRGLPDHLPSISTPPIISTLSPPYLHPQVCGELILAKALRVGIEQVEKGWGEIIRWSHLDCTRLPALRDEIDLGANEIAGLDDLAPEEQHLVREMVRLSWVGFGVGFAVAIANPNLNPEP